MINYFTIIKKSYHILKQNKVLLVPNLILVLIHVGFVFLVLFLSGISKYFNDIEDMMLGEGIIFDFIIKNFMKLVILVGMYLFLVLFTDTFFIGMKYGMIKDIIKKQKTSIKSGLEYGKKKFKTVLGIHALSFCIIYLPLLCLSVVIYYILKLIGIVGLFISVILVVLFLVYLVFVSFRMIFIYPVMAFEEKDTLSSFKKDFHYVKTHSAHTIISWIIVISIVLAIGSFKSISSYNFILSIILIIFVLGIEVFAQTLEHLFVFYSYLEGKK